MGALLDDDDGRRKVFRHAAEGILSGQRPRWGMMWGVPLPMWVEVNFSEYSVAISTAGAVFIQTPKNWGK